MNGKIVGSGLVGVALIAGAALYYLQVYYFYAAVPEGALVIRLTAQATDRPEPIAAQAVTAIDATSSPIRFRACFETPVPLAELTATYARYPAAEPLTAPGWFDCFDADAIGAALTDGTAQAFLGEAGIGVGVDRVVAVFPDGRGYVWHQLDPTFAD